MDPPPAGEFDLVHARLVLVHLPQREDVLRSMAAALRPGGWLLIEDFDSELLPLACVDVHGPTPALANKVRAAFRRVLTEHGADLTYARRLPRLLRVAGLVDVAADAYFAVGMPEAIALERANIGQTRDRLVEDGQVTADEIGDYLAALEAGNLDVGTAPLISAWGRRV